MTAYVVINQETNTRVDIDERDGFSLSAEALTDATGWTIKPEGFCLGDICVPAGDAVRADGAVDLNKFGERLGRPVVIDQEENVVSLGAAARDRGDTLQSLDAPDFTLPDLDGNLHSLSEYRGKKILLAAYASW